MLARDGIAVDGQAAAALLGQFAEQMGEALIAFRIIHNPFLLFFAPLRLCARLSKSRAKTQRRKELNRVSAAFAIAAPHADAASTQPLPSSPALPPLPDWTAFHGDACG